MFPGNLYIGLGAAMAAGSHAEIGICTHLVEAAKIIKILVKIIYSPR